MQLLEHEGKSMLARLEGLPVPRGALAKTPKQAAEVARTLGPQVVVKAQVPSGGRGRAGGVRIVARAEVYDCAESLLRSSVCGFPVHEVLVEEMLDATQEIYLAVALSAQERCAVLLLSSEGGMDVESAPEKVASVPIPSLVGLQSFHVWAAASQAGLDQRDVPGLVVAAKAIYVLFGEVQAELVEVNPVLRLSSGDLVAGDVRVIPTEEGTYSRAHPQPVSTLAQQSKTLDFDLVELDPDGFTGLLSTGAGASMMVVDLLSDAGARPINFCDFRSGRAQGAQDRLRFVLDYLGSRPNLRCLAINFFAGVTDLAVFGDVLAKTLDGHQLAVPVIVRVEGAGAADARERMRAVGATVVDSLDDLIRESTRAAATPGDGS